MPWLMLLLSQVSVWGSRNVVCGLSCLCVRSPSSVFSKGSSDAPDNSCRMRVTCVELARIGRTHVWKCWFDEIGTGMACPTTGHDVALMARYRPCPTPRPMSASMQRNIETLKSSLKLRGFSRGSQAVSELIMYSMLSALMFHNETIPLHFVKARVK